MKIKLSDITVSLSVEEIKIINRVFYSIHDSVYDRFTQEHKNDFQALKQEFYELGQFFADFTEASDE
jgi:hypothetical protein